MSLKEINGNIPENLGVTSESTEDLSEYADADESISAPTELLAEVIIIIKKKYF